MVGIQATICTDVSEGALGLCDNKLSRRDIDGDIPRLEQRERARL